MGAAEIAAIAAAGMAAGAVMLQPRLGRMVAEHRPESHAHGTGVPRVLVYRRDRRLSPAALRAVIVAVGIAAIAQLVT